MTFIPKVCHEHLKLVVAIIASLSSLSMANIRHYDLLSIDDRQMEAADRNGMPALSSGFNGEHSWESFNMWQCFSTEAIELECSELDYGARKVPTLRLRDEATLYDFSLDPEPGFSCEQTLENWMALLENQRSFCVYAAHLQEYNDNSFESDGIKEWHLWIVNQLKTVKGNWTSVRSDEEGVAAAKDQ